MSDSRTAPSPLFVMGMRIVESMYLPKQAKFQLSEEFAASTNPALVNETNAWLREFFGETDVAYMIGDHTMVVSPEHAAALRRLK